MGNESGYGKHFETLYDYTKKIDPTRPVQYEGGGYNSKSDIYCPCTHASGGCANT